MISLTKSKLYCSNARYYNSSLGRFISRDPVSGRNGNSLSRNGYIYVKNNPLKYVDPSGEEEEKKDESWWTKTKNYISKSGKQLLYGNYADDVTLLGTGGQIGTGLLDIDLPVDIRDMWKVSYIV